MLVDCCADRLGEAGEACVLGADVALQIRKLADELGRLIGLGEPCSLTGGIAAAQRFDENL